MVNLLQKNRREGVLDYCEILDYFEILHMKLYYEILDLKLYFYMTVEFRVTVSFIKGCTMVTYCLFCDGTYCLFYDGTYCLHTYVMTVHTVYNRQEITATQSFIYLFESIH